MAPPGVLRSSNYSPRFRAQIAIPRGRGSELGYSTVGEVSYVEYPRMFPDRPIPWRMRSLQKLEKIN